MTSIVSPLTKIVSVPNSLRIIVFSVFIGLLLSVFWSAQFVDDTIGDNVANTILGYQAEDASLQGRGHAIAESGLVREELLELPEDHRTH